MSVHIVIKERDGEIPNVHVYETAEEAIEEVRYAKMVQNYIHFDRLRLFESKELDIESIPPMTREEIKVKETDNP